MVEMKIILNTHLGRGENGNSTGGHCFKAHFLSCWTVRMHAPCPGHDSDTLLLQYERLTCPLFAVGTSEMDLRRIPFLGAATL